MKKFLATLSFLPLLLIGQVQLQNAQVSNFKVVPVVSGGPTSTEWVTGVTPIGSPRNDLDLRLGVKFTATAVTVTHLGRYCISGNSQTHVLYLFDTTVVSPCSIGSALASVTVDMAGKTPGTFAYGVLGSPVLLVNGRDYVIESVETASGDQWVDSTTTTTSAGTVVVSIYSDASACIESTAGRNFVPVSFKY